ncbi:hypothetical protein [Brevundimonas sp.]|uniref:hypothetical protein n=1 Tax=Brevundimonas sp. TaxID=1871086 RepID=UPI002731BAD9|nr:hypothetical protein [Brevundimonas sp.]MDP1912990.1 hypothetical protein [Brevundimonas sp.]
MSKSPPAKPDLRLVSAEAEIYDLMRTPATTADRVKRLQMEARALAVEQVEALEKLLMQASAMAQEIADGGDAYPVGARELAGRLAADLPIKAQTLKAVVGRSL